MTQNLNCTSGQNAGTVSRRSFLKTSAGAAGLGLAGIATSGAFQALSSKSAKAARLPFSPDYGPLVEAFDEATGLPLLRLPDGFRYTTFGWTGDEMSDGTPTPGLHDGMGVVRRVGRRLVLVRNHEQGSDEPSFARSSRTYDVMANGGTTNLVFDTRRRELVKSWASLSGTVRNCAGGITPWGSWLTCEETGVGSDTTPDRGFQETHGWILEVPGLGRARPNPIKDMGRFSHEAVAVDPASGYVYETEDARPAGFYRFQPRRNRRLAAGGRLQMLKIAGEDNVDLTGRATAIEVGARFRAEWVDIDDPAIEFGVACRDQGLEQGAAFFSRLEGCWYQGGSVFFVSTDGGLARKGQIWQYEPRRMRLTLIFVSPSGEVLNKPDNIAVSPGGGLLLCEDGGGLLDQNIGERMHGLTRDGEIFPFAENNVMLDGERGYIGDFRNREWAGATFSPDGRWLFANIQTPGITFAITGPWNDGAFAVKQRDDDDDDDEDEDD